MSCTGNKECSCGCDNPYGGYERVPLTFGDGGFISKRITDDIDKLVAEQFGGDEKLKEKAMAMVHMMAYGGLTDKTSGSVDTTVDPDAGKSTSAFDLGTTKDEIDYFREQEGTFKEELKDVGRFAAKTSLGITSGVIDTAANMLGADIDTGGMLKKANFGERTQSEIDTRNTAQGIASTVGSAAATVAAGIVTGGNPTVISRGAEQTFTELGEINPESQALQTISKIGETGAGIYGTVAGGGGLDDLKNLDLEGLSNAEKAGEIINTLVPPPQGTEAAAGVVGGAYGGPISYKPMPHGGPHTQTEALLNFLGNYDPSQDGFARGQEMRAQITDVQSDLDAEKQRVQDVRSDVIPTAQSMEAVNKRIMNATKDDPEAYAARQHFYKLIDEDNTVEETRELTRTAPSLLKQMLPNYGGYNLQLLNPTKYDAGDELYCTPMGCDTYRRAGAKDVPMVSGNLGFASAAKSGDYYGGYFPFEAIPESERVPGDIALKSDLTIMDYRGGKGPGVYATRPHHTTVYAGPGTQDNSIMSYQVDAGNRGYYGLKEETLPTMEKQLAKKADVEAAGNTVRNFRAPSFDYYRYVGAVPQYEQELAARQGLYENLSGQGFFDMSGMESLPPGAVPTNTPNPELQIPTNQEVPPMPEPKRGLFRRNANGGFISYDNGGETDPPKESTDTRPKASTPSEQYRVDEMGNVLTYPGQYNFITDSEGNQIPYLLPTAEVRPEVDGLEAVDAVAEKYGAGILGDYDPNDPRAQALEQNMRDSRDVTAAYMAGVPLAMTADILSAPQRYIINPLVAQNQGVEADYQPAPYSNYIFTGQEYGNISPSMLYGIENPYGAAAVDVAMDPMFIRGAMRGIEKVALPQLLKKTGKPVKDLALQYTFNPGPSVQEIAKGTGQEIAQTSATGAARTVAGEAAPATYTPKTFMNDDGMLFVTKEKMGERLQGPQNREAIARGNQFLADWKNDPATVEKIVKASKDLPPEALEGLLQAQPNVGEYPLDELEAFARGEYGERTIPTTEGYGVSYDGRTRYGSPSERGAYVRRDANIPQSKRESITVHEGTHHVFHRNVPTESHAGNLREGYYIMDDTGQSDMFLKNTDPSFLEDLKFYNTGPKGEAASIDPERAYRGYLAKPAEQHARIMQIRHEMGLKPRDKVTRKQAKEILDNLNAGALKNLYPEEQKLMAEMYGNNPRKVKNIFNKAFEIATPVAGAAGAAAATTEEAAGGTIEYKKGGSYQGGLRRWFKEEWKDVKTGKPCGRKSAKGSSRPYPYCRPSKRVSSKTPATSSHKDAKSRAAQKTGPKRVKPIMRKRSKK